MNVERGKALFEQLRPYLLSIYAGDPPLPANEVWQVTRAGVPEVKIGVPMHLDPEQDKPWTNPERAELRIHPADFDALKAYEGEILGTALSPDDSRN